MKSKLILVAVLMLSWDGDGMPMGPGQCNNFFKYTKISGAWVGQLSVPLPAKRLPLNVSAQLTLMAVLSSKYAGLIELTDTPDTVLYKIMEENAQSINYTVRFPLPYPLPQLTSLIVNNQTLCTRKPGTGPVVTNIRLEHEFPTNYFPIDDDYIKSKYNSGRSCGVSSLTKPIQGDVIGTGQWPWIAAVMIKETFDLHFHCTGTVISDKHIITAINVEGQKQGIKIKERSKASLSPVSKEELQLVLNIMENVLSAAHCVSKDVISDLSNEPLVVYLGKHDLRKWGEKNSQIKEVLRVIIHPDYVSSKYTADIAVLEMSTPIVLNKYVSPVCLWSGDTSLNSLTGSLGSVSMFIS